MTLIQRERLLPVPGKVVVRKGQTVGPRDVVAEAHLHPEHSVLDIARGLGVSADRADRYIQVKAGDMVHEGDIVAGPVGLARRVVRASRPGKVVVAGSGQVLVELETRPYELFAGLSGTVTELAPDYGAVVETSGALIQGVWGNGRIDFGLLHSVLRAPDDEIKAGDIDVSLRGSVVLGGYCSEEGVLTGAAEAPLRGLILTGMASPLLPLALKMRYALILIEGFGRRSMNSAAYKLLTTSVKREAAVNAEHWDIYAGTRPEVTIALPPSGEVTPPVEAHDFKAGVRVRVLRAPHPGAVGVILALLPGLTPLPSGVRTPAASVRLENNEEVVLALANLEVLE
jgi:hypothetical protein